MRKPGPSAGRPGRRAWDNHDLSFQMLSFSVQFHVSVACPKALAGQINPTSIAAAAKTHNPSSTSFWPFAPLRAWAPLPPSTQDGECCCRTGSWPCPLGCTTYPCAPQLRSIEATPLGSLADISHSGPQLARDSAHAQVHAQCSSPAAASCLGGHPPCPSQREPL